MNAAITLQNTENKNWKRVFIVLAVMMVIILPLLSRNYGQSGDEGVQIEYGQDIWNYFVHGDKQALDYSNKSLQYEGQQLYGGIFDFSMEVLHHWFPKIDQLNLRHFFNALICAVLMIFTGLFARRISRKWMVGCLALLFIVFSPRIFGEGMNNPKDIPHACGFTLGMYGLFALLQDFPLKRWRYAFILMLGFALAFGVRPAGGILLFAYFVLFIGLYYFLNKDFQASLKDNSYKLLKTFLLIFSIAIIGGFIIGLLGWPWGLEAPVSHSLETVRGMTNRDIVLRVLFEGEYHVNSRMPWYYELKWICMSNPLIVLAGAMLFIVLSLHARKKYGLFPTLFILFCSFFPLLYIIYKHSSVHDTWRHVFFVYVYWVVMGALGWDMLGDYIKRASLRWIPFAVAILGLIPTIYWTIYSNPNQYVYFNESVGGIKGAYGNYDIDYYQNSCKQQAEWILNNIKPVPGRKTVIVSNMTGFEKYFAPDTGWIKYQYCRYNDRSQKDWDYYIDYPRFLPVEQLQNNLWPPQNVIHTVSVDNVPLSIVIARKSKAGIPAYDALQKKDFTTAAQQYAEYIKADTTDENVYVNYGIALASAGKIDEGIHALVKATQLNPSQAQYFQLLAQLYHTKGDDADAQKAMGNAQAISAKEQEDADE